jgi:hypothetical protein
MLFIVYLVWGVFLLLAARKPLEYKSFLAFTMWANLLHGLLMAAQAGMMMDRYWSKWFTDIPFVLLLALGIYRWRPTASQDGRDHLEQIPRHRLGSPACTTDPGQSR